jgi:hypothetical protein
MFARPNGFCVAEMKKAGETGIMPLTNFSGGRDAALRRPRPAGRNERGKSSFFPSPNAALGDGDSAARYPYLDSL